MVEIVRSHMLKSHHHKNDIFRLREANTEVNTDEDDDAYRTYFCMLAF